MDLGWGNSVQLAKIRRIMERTLSSYLGSTAVSRSLPSTIVSFMLCLIDVRSYSGYFLQIFSEHRYYSFVCLLPRVRLQDKVATGREQGWVASSYSIFQRQKRNPPRLYPPARAKTRRATDHSRSSFKLCSKHVERTLPLMGRLGLNIQFSI